MVFVDGSSVSRTLITWYQTLADCQSQRTEDAPRDEVVYRRWSCHYVSRTIIKVRGAYGTTTVVDWSFVDARLPQADLGPVFFGRFSVFERRYYRRNNRTDDVVGFDGS